jgi:cation diffusion facilitator family transporter
MRHTIEEKDYRKIRDIWGKRAGVIGLVLNFCLSGIKFSIGVLFNSVALIADAVNNLSDMAASLIIIIGFKLSGKPADEKHPYGHARMEYIAGFMISMILVFLGLQLLWSSVEKILHPQKTIFSMVSLVVLFVSVLIKLALWIFYTKTGKKIHSVMLIASSHDSRNDALSSSAIILSMLLLHFYSLDIDGYIGALLALFIIYSGIRLVIDTINPLLGSAPPEKFVKEISDKLLSYTGVIGIHDLIVHNYGYKRSFASVHCEVPASQDIMVSHDIIDRIERDFMRDMKVSLVTHLDPIVTDDERTRKAKADIQRIVRNISDRLSLHDFRVVWGIKHVKYIFDLVIPYNYEYTDEETVEAITSSISDQFPEVGVVITVDHQA